MTPRDLFVKSIELRVSLVSEDSSRTLPRNLNLSKSLDPSLRWQNEATWRSELAEEEKDRLESDPKKWRCGSKHMGSKHVVTNTIITPQLPVFKVWDLASFPDWHW